MDVFEPIIPGQIGSKGKQLTPIQRRSVFEFLLECSVGGHLPYGTINDAATKFTITRKVVSAIWQQGRQSVNNGSVAADFTSRKVGKVGRKRKTISQADIESIPKKQRGNIRSTAAALNIGVATAHKLLKEGILKAHSNAVKPFLTDENKKARLKYCLSMLDSNSVALGAPHFQNMNDHVHVDEKWFYISKNQQKYYLAAGEEPPHRTCKSKRFVTKVMFLAAVARPRWNTAKNKWFDGKLGIWPFVTQEPAKRSSKNRVAGTMVTKNIDSVTKVQYSQMITEKVIPAIRNKWPNSTRSATIVIQQDNAKPHISPADIAFNEAVQASSMDIQLACQPPNSPDTNVLDLGFFNAIQALQHQKVMNNIDELIAAVQAAFQELDKNKLSKVFLTHQSCMNEILKCGGGNKYQIPHLSKDRLINENCLPDHLSCAVELIEAAMEAVNDIASN